MQIMAVLLTHIRPHDAKHCVKISNLLGYWMGMKTLRHKLANAIEKGGAL